MKDQNALMISSTMILCRDGVGDGQIPFVFTEEIKNLKVKKINVCMGIVVVINPIFCVSL